MALDPLLNFVVQCFSPFPDLHRGSGLPGAHEGRGNVLAVQGCAPANPDFVILDLYSTMSICSFHKQFHALFWHYEVECQLSQPKLLGITPVIVRRIYGPCSVGLWGDCRENVGSGLVLNDCVWGGVRSQGSTLSGCSQD
jgi:hypothetical protein